MIDLKTQAVPPFSPNARTFHNIYKLQKHVLLRHQSYLIVFMGNKKITILADNAPLSKTLFDFWSKISNSCYTKMYIRYESHLLLCYRDIIFVYLIFIYHRIIQYIYVILIFIYCTQVKSNYNFFLYFIGLYAIL